MQPLLEQERGFAQTVFAVSVEQWVFVENVHAERRPRNRVDKTRTPDPHVSLEDVEQAHCERHHENVAARVYMQQNPLFHLRADSERSAQEMHGEQRGLHQHKQPDEHRKAVPLKEVSFPPLQV